LFAEQEGQDIAVIIGGIISKDDAVQLTAMGTAEVFGPRSSTGDHRQGDPLSGKGTWQ